MYFPLGPRNITDKYGLNKDGIYDTMGKDAFCPRKQLDNLVAGCGSPDLHIDDGMTVTDANNTLDKMMSKVDNFVIQYTGEDLRYSVVKELKKKYNSQVKAFVAKETNACARASEKAKTYEDFDWETLIRGNNLGNLYVSQLDLYLLENVGLSKKDCVEKGFTKIKKIEAIKKHFYSSVTN